MILNRVLLLVRFVRSSPSRLVCHPQRALSAGTARARAACRACRWVPAPASPLGSTASWGGSATVLSRPHCYLSARHMFMILFKILFCYSIVKCVLMVSVCELYVELVSESETISERVELSWACP